MGLYRAHNDLGRSPSESECGVDRPKGLKWELHPIRFNISLSHKKAFIHYLCQQKSKLGENCLMSLRPQLYLACLTLLLPHL